MSTHKYYIPTDFSGRYLWCDNFREKLAPMKEKYNIAPGDWSRLEAGTTALGQANQFLDRVHAFGHAWTKYRQQLWQDPEPRDLIPPFDASFSVEHPMAQSDFEDFLRRLVRHIQGQPEYTVADGRALGLYGPEITVDIDTAKPVPRLLLSGGRVHVKYEKHHVFTGVRCYADRGDGKLLALGTFTRVSFEDPATLPAEATRWIYRLRYVMGDAEVGQLSDPAEILVSASR